MTEELMKWIVRNASNLPYGELNIILKFHDGRLTVIEKSRIERTKPEVTR